MSWIKKFRANLKSMKEDGSGSCVFATMDVIDKDEDLTILGAFGQQKAKVCGAHNWSVPNVGFANIREEGADAVADFQFYLEMPSAKEWYQALLNNFKNGVPQEWSYGFDVLEEAREQRDGRNVRILKRLKVHEISPVMIGAGVGTRTTLMKAWGQMRGSWESLQESIRQAASAVLLGDREGWVSIEGTFDDAVVASVWIEGAEGTKYYQFTWSIQPDGSVTLADQSEVDLQVVVREKSLKLEDSFSRVVGEVVSLKGRCVALAAMRAADRGKEGRVLSRANRDRLSTVADAISQLRGVEEEIRKLLAETDPESEKGQAEALQLFGEYQRARSKMHAHFNGA